MLGQGFLGPAPESVKAAWPLGQEVAGGVDVPGAGDRSTYFCRRFALWA